MQPKTVNSTWVWCYEGNLWPVVLCDDDTPPKIFMESRPPGNVFPAILLGRHKYIWVAEKGLEEYTPSKDYLSITSSTQDDRARDTESPTNKYEQERCNAFLQDAVQFQSTTFWKNYIESKSEARKLERRLYKRKRSSKETLGVRSTSLTSRSPLQHRCSDENATKRGQLPTPGPTPVKGGLSGISWGAKASTEYEEVDDDDDKNEDPSVRQSKIKSDPFVDSEGEDEGEDEHDMELQRARARNKQSVMNDPPSDDFCTIFVGESHTPFLVPKEAVGRCDFLADRVCFNDDIKAHIELDQDTDVEAKYFVPIHDFLRHGEFKPRLIDSGSHQRLEAVALSEEKDKAAVDIAMVYSTASKIHFANLQMLCVNKLKVLYPLDLNKLLIVVMVVSRTSAWGCDAEDDIMAWMIDYVTERFWQLVATEGMTFRRVMAGNASLRQSVLAKLAQNAEAGRLGLEDD